MSEGETRPSGDLLAVDRIDSIDRSDQADQADRSRSAKPAPWAWIRLSIGALIGGFPAGGVLMIVVLVLFDPHLEMRKVIWILAFDGGLLLVAIASLLLLRGVLWALTRRAARARDRVIPAMRVVAEPASWGRE